MFTVNKCCCCLKLSTGAYILGIIGVIDSIISLISTATILSHYEEAVEVYGKKDPELVEQMVQYKPAFISVLSGIIIFCIITLICQILLVRGVYKKNAKMLLPILILALIVYVLFLVSIIIQIMGEIAAGYIIAEVILLGLSIYFWICLYSLYESFKNFETV